MELETSSAQTVSDLKGTTIGVIKGNPAGSDFVDLLNKTYPNKFQIKAYENVSDIVNALNNKSISAAFMRRSSAASHGEPKARASSPW